MDQEDLIRAVSAALNDIPADGVAPEVLAAAERLITDQTVTGNEVEELLDVVTTDEQLADAIDFYLSEDGYRGPLVRDFGGTPADAIWWVCPEQECTREPEPGDGQGPYRYTHCPDHGVRLARK